MTAQPASNDVFEDGSSDWIETSRRKAPPTIALDNTEKTSNTYKVLLKISIPDTPGIKINQMVDIRAVLDKLFDVNPEIKLISLDKKFQISTMREFPRSQTHFENSSPAKRSHSTNSLEIHAVTTRLSSSSNLSMPSLPSKLPTFINFCWKTRSS